MTLDHVTLRTNNLESTKDFFIKVFDLEERKRPKVIERIQGYWLFKGNQPIVHLIKSYGRGWQVGFEPEAIDHVGIKLEGYRTFKEKLRRLQIPYSLMDIEEIHERRVFFRTPEGVLLEAVFDEEIETVTT